MANNAEAVRVAGTGSLWISRLNANPANVTGVSGALPAAQFDDYGFIAEDGLTLSKSTDWESIPAWQSSAPVRRVLNSTELTITAPLLESTDATMQLWSGGTVTSVTGGKRISIPTDPEAVPRQVVIDYRDKNKSGVISSRIVIPAAIITETADVSLVRTDAVKWEVTLEAVYNGTDDLAYILTNG